MPQVSLPVWVYWIPVMAALASGVIAWLVAFFTAKNAASRFYSEKWFEKKTEAYVKVIEVLHRIKKDVDNDIWGMETYGSIPRLTDEGAQHRREIAADLYRLMDMGELFFSDDVITLFPAIRKAMDQHDYGEHYFDSAALISKTFGSALEQIRPLAKRDLRS